MTPAAGVRQFCTYFDHRYLDRGLLLLESLHRHAGEFTLHVLCLNDHAFAVLTRLGLARLRLWRLADLEAAEPRLAGARTGRTLVEYYFTLTPLWPRFLFDRLPAVDTLTYLDSDLYFFASPEIAFAAIGDAPLAITPHRFSVGFATDIKYGRFNVGWLTFRRHPTGLACLERWSEQCLDWCHDRLEGDRFADQKYLDAWPELYPDLAIIDHPGVNAGPWNIDAVEYAAGPDGPTLDGRPLVCFHFQGIRQNADGQFQLGLEGRRLDRYGDPRHPLYRDLYGFYLQRLVAARQALAPHLPVDGLGEPARPLPGRAAGPAFERLPQG